MATDQQQLCSDLTILLNSFRSASDWQDFAPLEWFSDVLAEHEMRSDGFEPQFLAGLAYAGWFLFCAGSLTPKFHRRKMLVDVQRWNAVEAVTRFEELPTDVKPLKPKPLRKRLDDVLRSDSRFVLQMATDFESTLARTNEFQAATHGRTWIEPEFATALCSLATNPVRIGRTSVRGIAWDLRDAATNELLAADIGYQVGATYSSMSGFSDRRFSSLGIVQLLAQAEVMQSAGITIWDLGMPMAYKYGMGAVEATGEQWLQVLHECRDVPTELPTVAVELTALPGLRQLHLQLTKNN